MDRSEVERILEKAGIPRNSRGFLYIADAVMIVDEDITAPAVKGIYEKIAKKYSVTACSVTNRLQWAFETARRNGGTDAEYYIGQEGIGNAAAIRMLHMQIERELREEKELKRLEENEAKIKDAIRKIIKEELKNQRKEEKS